MYNLVRNQIIHALTFEVSSGQKQVAKVLGAYIAFIFKPVVERLLQSKKNSTVRKISLITGDSQEAETDQ